MHPSIFKGNNEKKRNTKTKGKKHAMLVVKGRRFQLWLSCFSPIVKEFLFFVWRKAKEGDDDDDSRGHYKIKVGSFCLPKNEIQNGLLHNYFFLFLSSALATIHLFTALIPYYC